MQSLDMNRIWINIPHRQANRAWANWLGCRASIREECKKLFKHPRQYESSLIILPSSRRDQTWHLIFCIGTYIFCCMYYLVHKYISLGPSVCVHYLLIYPNYIICINLIFFPILNVNTNIINYKMIK